MSTYTYTRTAITPSCSFFQCITLPPKIPWQCVRCRREITSQKLFKGRMGSQTSERSRIEPKLIHYMCCICLLLKGPERSGCLVYFHCLTANYLQTSHLQETPTSSTFINSELIKVAFKSAWPHCQLQYVDW